MSHLILPKLECTELSDKYGCFVAEPLERGFGITLGNSMRRVLLSSLPGAAITWILIEGIEHEFSTIPDAKEDTIEFLLNIKAIRLHPLSTYPGKLTLEVNGEQDVCAADIKPSSDFEIANPELHLITLDSAEAKLFVEFNVEHGIGYKPASQSNNLPIGAIPVDAIFTPVRRVNYSIENTRIGQQTNYEKLILEVWTDGTISPMDAVKQSARIIIEQLSCFKDLGKTSTSTTEEKSTTSISSEYYNMPIEQLGLSGRIAHCLRRNRISTVGELLEKEKGELLQMRSFGQKSWDELQERLYEIGITSTPPIDIIETPFEDSNEVQYET